MNWTIILKFIKYLVISLLLIALQNAMSTFIYPLLWLPDITTCLILLFMFHTNDEFRPWVFIFAFILGIIEATWMSQKIGLLSMYYMTISYPFSFFRSINQSNLELIILVIVAFICKFLVFTILGYLLNLSSVINFIYSLEFVYQFLATMVMVCVFFFPINAIINKRRRSRK